MASTTMLAFIPPPRLALFATGADADFASTSVSVARSGGTQVVPDSVDPHLPLLCAVHSQNSVLVAETPDRPPRAKRAKRRRSSVRGADADKSRVVLQSSSEPEDAHPPQQDPPSKSTVCRFSFFGKPAAKPSETPQTPPADEDSRGFLRLPAMNVRDATQITLSDQDSLSAAGIHSILPPPTLHFPLGNVTPLSSILANPALYTEARPWTGHTLGAISRNVNLLVVIKEIADVSRVRAKFPVDNPAARKTGYARKWDDSRTERVELVVLDGRMRPDAPECVAEKHMFRIVLWGNLARQWTTEPDESVANMSAQSGSRSSLYIASSREPTALRAGDVIHIDSLTLSSPADSTSQTGKRPRLGAGFPPRPLQLVGNGSEHKSTSIELCYRTDVFHRRDAAHNFDADIARFDLKSRRVLELSRLFLASNNVRLEEM